MCILLPLLPALHPHPLLPLLTKTLYIEKEKIIIDHSADRVTYRVRKQSELNSPFTITTGFITIISLLLH